MNKPKRKLSDVELDIMLIVWDAKEPISAPKILEKIFVKHSWALSSLMTALSRLVDKGYLKCDRSSGSNLYSAIVDEQQYKNQESSSFLSKLYGNSLPHFVSCLYKGGKISNKDLEELKRFIDNATKEN